MLGIMPGNLSCSNTERQGNHINISINILISLVCFVWVCACSQYSCILLHVQKNYSLVFTYNVTFPFKLELPYSTPPSASEVYMHV